jgi:hypothetical protein
MYGSKRDLEWSDKRRQPHDSCWKLYRQPALYMPVEGMGIQSTRKQSANRYVRFSKHVTA